MNAGLGQLRRLLRPGDYLVWGLLAFAVLSSARHFWRGDTPDTAVVRAAGKILVRLPLNETRSFIAPGPLGNSRIEIEPGRARVAADPGPRQYCVKQGWLTHAGAVAICAPNQVSLSLEGGKTRFDSLSY